MSASAAEMWQYVSHYSLLRTTDAPFGIDEFLGHAADERRGVARMMPLFGVVH